MHILSLIFLAIAWCLVLPDCSQAEVVGRFEKVEGPVNLLKQGKLPALSPQVQEGVEPGDVIRTKSQGRAQVKFVDDSVLTIAPGSRVAIDTFSYDPNKGTRKAVLQVFRGMVQTVVTKLLKSAEPNFVMKTHTAVLGVRGTKWYTLLSPNATDIYNESGRVCVRNLYSEIKGEVCLNAMEFSRVALDMTPTAAMPFQKQDLAPLEQMLQNGSSSVSGPQSSLGLTAPLPLAFLDKFSLSDLRSGVADFRLSLDRQPIFSRDLLSRDRELLSRLPNAIDVNRPGINPGSHIPSPGGGISTPGFFDPGSGPRPGRR